MSNYRSQYERYYKNMLNQKKGINSGQSMNLYNSKQAYTNDYRNSKKKLGIINKIIFQCVASVILFVIIFSLKIIPIQKTKEVYMISKQYLTQDFSKDINYSYVISVINKVKSTDIKGKAVDCINLLKEKTNKVEKTSIKSKIKDNYCLPVLASYMKLQGDIQGVLLEGKEGEQVICSMDGTVVKSTANDEGQNILINHGDGIQTYYGMIKNSDIKEGDEIKKGEYLGDCNKISNTEKTGVVFKFIYMGKEQDPTEYLDFSNLKNV
ncbi:MULTISPECIES: M23 family metallopeptidase [unclassified Clostridium]|uniref:M23 family metallopeptidase n=1 Tax=unclassified Clostridium TaxID=2614128 RepID=UPI0013F8A055|nr:MULTISPECIES: M23 family metallopeptidase [unclassified Clostridium]MBN1044265.1 M23 family peptidase [Clostridium botulinum]NFN92540.1 M23 family metallopeptidase [Clostridium botulinum]NFS96065.1 M23 family metallopeptidase [Clostridium botulinum]